MGKPLPPSANPATGAPGAGDQANGVVTGAFSATGQVSQPFVFYGAFNVFVYGSVSTTLTTQAGTVNATVASATGIGPGENINSTIVPPGTVVASGGSTTTTVQLGGLTTAQIAAITAISATAVFVGAGIPISATVALERSFDGGSTWVTCGVGNAGVQASYVLSGTIPQLSLTVAEPEKGVAYRLNCISYGSGTINYRVSATGNAATTWGPNVG